MLRVWQIIYSLVVIPLLWVILRVMGLGKQKVRRGIKGRVGLFAFLQRRMKEIHAAPRIWFHASSMGEFEQAKPIIQELKTRHPGICVIATFFSPSGYEHSRNYHLADVTSYLPFDTPSGARRFVELVQPDAAVMVRYDVWPNHIWELQRRGIPTLIANATMRRQTKRGLPLIRSFHHHVYNAINEILTVSESDADTFRLFRLNGPVIRAIGDTRYDQVAERSKEAGRRHIIPEDIIAGKKIIVVGSSWREDEEVIIPAFLTLQQDFPNLLLIIVPHEPVVEHIEGLEDTLREKTSFIRFSGLNEYSGERVIIVDSVGILLILYRHAHIAFVGGSFRQGVHNVLEAAVFGVPVVFGPRYRNSQEPLMLVERGGAFVVNDSRELYRTCRNLLEDDLARTTAGERAAGFVQAHVGATARFLDHLEKHIRDPRKQNTHRS